MTSFVDSVFVGQPKKIEDAQGAWVSSILRERINAPIQLLKCGLVGDRVAQPYHGGPDAAVCVHLCDHYRFWNRHYGLNLRPGSVGENFVLDEITEEQVCVGDIVRIGAALVQISGPRVPCANLARRLGRSDWVKKTIQENRTGFYGRVLEPGMVQAGDTWKLQERLNPGGSIPAINRCIYLAFDRALAISIANMAGLGDWWKQQFNERLEKQDRKHWTETMSS